MSTGLLESFPCLANTHTKTVILGSMPGKASLNESQYYAHPQNCFWRLMEDLLHINRSLPYATRVEQLLQSGYGLWDVIRNCHRDSSLDADIVDSTVAVNDFAAFFQSHRQVRAVYFNGAKAESIFMKQVLPNLVNNGLRVNFVTRRLPSTSPAHASLSYEEKRACWSAIVD